MLRSRQLAATAHNVPLAVAQSRHFAPDRLADAGFIDALVRTPALSTQIKPLRNPRVSSDINSVATRGAGPTSAEV